MSIKHMTELESLKEDLYELVGELRKRDQRDILGMEDEYFHLGKDEAADRLTVILREQEHNAS